MPATGALPPEMHDSHSLRLLADYGMLDPGFQDADIRRARHAYFGSISYLDRLIGRILAALADTGAADSTTIVFTSDHGDMLDERGMWLKKHFFEPSLKIPLILRAPWISRNRVSELVSLVDLLPTFCGLAAGQRWDALPEELAGEDLTGFLTGGRQEYGRAVYAEYLAEAALAPIFMIRRGKWKYIESRADPALLFDVESDPLELNNLAGRRDLKSVVDAFRAEADDRWDTYTLTKDILKSQRRRKIVLEASRIGAAPRWNHGERSGQNVHWYRGIGGYNEWAFSYLGERGADTAPSDRDA